ncbi:MAG: DUF417 family protein [Pseudomonadota bacterium]
MQSVNNATLGEKFLRVTLGGFFLWMGFLKFFAYEVNAVSGLMMTSPLTSWFVNAFGNTLSVGIIGVVELLAAVLILVGFQNAKLGAVGSSLAILTLVVTSTFLVFGPVIQEGHSFPFLSPMPGQFILKDIPLLGAALWLFMSDRSKT